MKKFTFPKHLSQDSRKWAIKIDRTWVLEVHQRALLTSAAEVRDRLAECRAAIKKDGMFFQDRFGQLRAHPALVEERNHRIAFARLLRELNLSEESEEARIPGLKY